MMLHRHFAQKQAEVKEPPKKTTPVFSLEQRKNVRKKRTTAAVYAGTRNLYPHMVTAAKSLLMHSDVDRVYFLIEDDTFPYEIPKEIECINIKNQTIFNQGSPNFHNNWTYMVLMRAALTKIFPDYDRIVSLDVDTIVVDDISELWKMDIGNCVMAAVQEYHSHCRPYGSRYWNAGVMVQDLWKFRQIGLDDKIIYALNHEKFQYNEQCALNKYCMDMIYDLPVRFNDCYICGETDNPAIIHYIGSKEWATNPQIKHYDLLEKYRATTWADVKKARKERYSK